MNKIEDSSFAASQKYELIGDILLTQQNLTGAAESYEKSPRINSGDRRALLKLVRLYRETDPPRASQYEKRLKYISAFYDLF